MNSYFNWAVIGTTATMVWGYFSGFASRLRSLFIVNVRLSEDAGPAFMYMLWNDFQRTKWGDKHYGGTNQHIIPLGKSQKVGYEGLPAQPLIFWRGWKPLSVKMLTYASSPNEFLNNVVQATYIRGTFNFDQLMIRAFDLINEKDTPHIDNHRFRITKIFGREKYPVGMQGKNEEEGEQPTKSGLSKVKLQSVRILKWGYDDLGAASIENPLDGYAFPKKVLELIQDIRTWMDSKDWFVEKRIPWRYGVLLTSKPGCGKSSLCKAIGQLFDLPIFSFNLSTLTNKEFNDYWEEMMTCAPCIFLVEDIDGIFNGRQNVNKDGLTFDCFLNAISGVSDSDGILTMITTNDLSKVDAAIGIKDAKGKVSRPGRINKILHLGNMDLECRTELAKKILIDCPEKIVGAIKKTKNFTPAQTQEYFAGLALDHYWSKK